jgi:hypothetical protein
MKCFLKKTAYLFLIAYLIVLYAFIIPSHVHKDFLEHKRCVLCQCSHLTATTVSACIIVFFLVTTVFILSTQRARKPFILIPLYSTRAPPPWDQSFSAFYKASTHN